MDRLENGCYLITDLSSNQITIRWIAVPLTISLS